jgi:predicted amidophosphoribosyltransferase
MAKALFDISYRICSACGNSIPGSPSSGDICPHCCSSWSEEELFCIKRTLVKNLEKMVRLN